MTWAEWSAIWAVALALTGTFVGLAFWLGVWALPIVFVLLFLGFGLVVTRG